MSFPLMRVVRNVVAIAVAEVVHKLVFTLYHVLVARSMSVAELGVFSLAATLGNSLWPLVDGGTHGHAMKTAAQARPEELPALIGQVSATRLATTLIVTLFLILFLVVFPIPWQEGVIYLSASVYLAAQALFPQWLSRGRQDNGGYMRLFWLVGFCLLVVLAVYLWLPATHHTAVWAAWLRNGAWLVAAVVGVVLAQGRLGLVTVWRYWRPDWSTLMRTYPLGIAAILYHANAMLPQLLLRWRGEGEILGYYGAAWQIQQILFSGGIVFSLSLLPMLAAELHGEVSRPRLLRVLAAHFGLLFLVSLVLNGSLAWHGDWVAVTFYGPAYAPAGWYLSFFAVVLFLVYLRFSMDALLIVLGNYHLMVRSGLVGLLVTVTWLAVFPDRVVWAYGVAEVVLLVINGGMAVSLLRRRLRGEGRGEGE